MKSFWIPRRQDLQRGFRFWRLNTHERERDILIGEVYVCLELK